MPFIWRLYGSHIWRVLRGYWAAGVLRLRGIVQRRVCVQSALHHRLQRQGDRAAYGSLATTQPTAITAHAAWYGLLIPAAVATSWYCGHRIAASAPSVATDAARNEHRLAASSAATQRGVLDIATTAAVAAATARNRVRVAPACSSAGCGVPAIAAATTHAPWRFFAATCTAAGRGLRHISAPATDHHALPRLPVPDCRVHHHLVQRDRSDRGRWRIPLQHRRQRRVQGLEARRNNLQHRTGSGQHGQQGRLVVPFVRRLYGPCVWRVLRRDWPAGVLRLRGNVQRRVCVQSALHHRLQWQGNRAARRRIDTAAVPPDPAGHGLLLPATVTASWYRCHRITPTPSSFATHAARNEHRLAASSASTQRGVLAVAAAVAVAAAAARNRVRLAAAVAPSWCGVPAIASAAANAPWRFFAATCTAAWCGLRHAVSRVPLSDRGMHHDLVQRDRTYRGRWRVSLQHR